MANDRIKRDQELVRQFQAGDVTAYAKLFVQYKDAVYFMLLKLVSDPKDAEDLTYESFDKAFRNIEKYNPKFAFSTWLFRIANNTCIDFFRTRKSNNHVSIANDVEGADKNVSIGEETIQSSALDPEETMIRSQQEALMKNLMKQLKPKYQEILKLRYFKDFAYEEIAATLKIPIGTVKTLLNRAKSALGELLTQKFIEEENNERKHRTRKK